MGGPVIPYARQSLHEADVEAVVAVLRSPWWTQGPAVERFEGAVAGRCGAGHAVAVNSATSALHLACLALGLGPGERLWTSPLSFVASANCARHCGAEVGFVDVDPRTGNLCPRDLEARLERARRDGVLPRVLVAVHFAGQPCELATIGELARHYGVALIEDASHALGARYQGEAVGNCRHSALTVFSFHPVKIVAAGEGGMALTQCPELAERLIRLRSHGITRDPRHMTGEPDGPWFYQQLELGYNYRLSDIHAALGASQLERLDAFLARRRDLARRYDAALAELDLTRPGVDPRSESAWHLYVVRLARRRRVFEHLRAAGIGVNVHYIPIHTQPYYRALGFAPGDFPAAENFYREAITLPLHPALEDSEQDRVVSALEEALS